LDADVRHRPWQGAALLHRPLLDARLWRVHARRRDPTEPARNLERSALSGIPPRAAERRSARGLRALRSPLEPLMAARAPAPAAAEPRRPRVALVIPTLNEEEPIGEVIRAVPRDLVDDIIVADSGSGATAAPAPPAPRRRATRTSSSFSMATAATGPNSCRNCSLQFLRAPMIL